MNTTYDLEENLKHVIRDVPNFPKPGIIFKDITPILQQPKLCGAVVDAFVQHFSTKKIDVVAGVESRGFLFGMLLANKLNVPFVPIRKRGKLPSDTIDRQYDLEYGQATIEIHRDAFAQGAQVLIHDDLLATGGTIRASSELVKDLGGHIVGYAFLISLDFLKGKETLMPYSDDICSLIDF